MQKYYTFYYEYAQLIAAIFCQVYRGLAAISGYEIAAHENILDTTYVKNLLRKF